MTGVDEATGATYYYNEQTGVSQWEPPAVGLDQSLVEECQAATALGYNAQAGTQVVWILAPSDTVLHEYAVRNGEEQVLGRNDMVKPNPYVSREQCLLRVADDGTASVVAKGKAQVYIFTESEKAPPGDMLDHTVVFGEGDSTQVLRTVVLRTGQAHAIKDGDQIVFRQAKYTAYAQQDFQNGWVTGVDEASGQAYYYNQQTGQYQWEPPQAHAQAVAGAAAATAQYAAQHTSAAQLAPGWVTGVDEATSATYYYHEQTGVSQWEPPQF